MRRKAILWRRTGTLLVTVAMLGGVGTTQNKTSSGAGQIPITQNPLPPLGPELPASQQEKQAKARNDDRQKRLEADTAKLLQLATQLHEDVGKTNKDILSIDVIRRADEIEKLAHAVKDRMRG